MPDLSALLAAGYDTANALSLATAVAALSILFLGAAVLWRGRNHAPSRLFFLLTVVAAAWLSAFAAMYASLDATAALIWARSGYVFGALIAAAVFHFATTLTASPQKYRLRVALFWAGCALAGGVGFTTDLLIPYVRRFPFGFYPAGRPFGGLIVLCFFGMIIASIHIFWRMYRGAEGKARERAGALLLAFVLGSLGMFDYLPSVGIDLQPIGYVAALAFVIVAATAVWRFELEDITPEYAAGQILETMKSAVVVSDMMGRIRVVNRGAERLLGYKEDELRDSHLRKVLERDDTVTTGQLINSLGVLEHPMVWRAADGSRVDVLATSSFLRDEEGGPVGVVYVANDFTERKRAEQALRESEHRYRTLFERNLAGVYRSGTDGRVLDCNDACARIFGYESREQFIGTNAHDLYFDESERERVIQMLRNHAQLSNLELRLRRRDGTTVWVLENVTFLPGEILEGTIIDITDRKHAQEQMEYQAYHDALTLLPNRLLFRDRITVALAHARRHARVTAVMFLDLDQFKLVNDTLGHTVGDRLLQVIGARLVTCVRAEDTVARMGGDEFTILLADLNDRRGASSVAQKVLDAVRHPVVVDEHELFVTTSVGIAMFPDDGEDAESLLKNADRAMYRAKEQGRDNYQFATPARFDATDGRLALERKLRHALERNEFLVHYQPMVEIASGRVVGAEALVRWHDPEVGLVQPEEFVPVAEETQLIVPLGAWVLRTACKQMKAWHDAGHAWLRVAVNLSPRQFQDRELVATVERVLAETGFPAPFLDLEITESTAMQNVDLSLSILNRLKEMGIRISIDDFGTGYSSLSYLKRFPIDTVKIDQDFVRDLTRDDAAIISAVISMARALNLRVIAEGVETEEQLAFLRREQCAEMQGFLYSKPLSASDFERALRTGSRSSVSASPANRLRLTLE